MNFSTLTSAERLKASAMIGAIILVMIFLVHTIMGAVSPKKPANNNKAGATQTVQNPPPAPPKTEVAQTSGDLLAGDGLWPGSDPLSPNGSGSGKVTADPVMQKAVTDPFEPTISSASPKKPGAPEPVGKPLVSVTPTGQQQYLPPTGGPGPNAWGPAPNYGQPGVGAPQTTQVAAVAPPPPAEPQIRLIGIVVGEPSVATLEVDGRVVLVRAGEALIDGYRLMEINGEGIRIRHNKRIFELRSGVTINQVKAPATGTPN